MNPHCTALLSLALACGIVTPASAAAVHKWIDADGVTHYSDQPPDSVDTTLIELPEPTALKTAGEDGGLADDYYSIPNQWQRMNQERIERERLNLERERARAARQTAAPTATVVKREVKVRYVPIFAGFGLFPHHPHHRYDTGPRHQPKRPAQPAPGVIRAQ